MQVCHKAHESVQYLCKCFVRWHQLSCEDTICVLQCLISPCCLVVCKATANNGGFRQSAYTVICSVALGMSWYSVL